MGAWGIRGQLKVRSETDFPERFAPGSELHLNGAPAVVMSARPHRGGLVVGLSSVEDRNAAESLRGSLLTIREDQLAALPEGTYYHFQLIGMDVFTDEGEGLGRIAEILETPGNDVYIVRKEGGRDLLLPALKSVVLSVDVASARMRVRMTPGLR